MTLTSVTGYLVEYWSHCDNQCNRAWVGSGNTTTIEGLHSYSNYTLRMTVVCSTTPSTAFSPPETFNTTSQGESPQPPVHCALYNQPTPPHPSLQL